MCRKAGMFPVPAFHITIFSFHYQYTHPIMQKNKFRNCLQILPVLFLMAFVSASCIKDDLSGCPSPHVSGLTLQVKAYDADGVTLDSETIKDITLYVFDKDKTLLDILHTSLSELVTLDYPGHDVLKLVAWGNGRQGGQTLSALRQGDHLETAFVSLIHQPQTRITYPVAGSPDDLFYGTIDIQTSADAPSAAGTLSAKELPLRRKVSGVAVTARHLKEYVGSSDGDFHYILRKTGNMLDFYGLPNGTDVSYRPEASFNDQGHFVSSVFNILPTDDELRIDIYHRDVLRTTIISDSSGKPLRVTEGRLLNVLVDFKGDISVEVKVTDWGKQEIWKEF